MRASLWRPPTGKDEGGYDDDKGGPMYRKGEESFYKTLLEREATNTQKGTGKRRKKSRKKKGGKKSRKKKGDKKSRKKKTRSRKYH